MRVFVKYLLLAFFSQVAFAILSGLLVEFTGILVFWWLSLCLYIFPADAILRFSYGTLARDAGDLATTAAFVIPIGLYSLVIAGVMTAWKRRSSKIK